MYYPLFLNISAMHCLIVGAGAVGLRKAQGLLHAKPASLLVLDTQPLGAEWDTLRQSHLPNLSNFRCEVRAFDKDDIMGRSLVFACTGNRRVNASIAQACVAQGIWCNCVDAPTEGNCIVPAVARQGDLVAAVSTGGGSPALARVLREELEDWLAPTAMLARLLARLRPHVLARQHNTAHNTVLFRTLARSGLRQALHTQDAPLCATILRERLPDALHPLIPELLHEFF